MMGPRKEKVSPLDLLGIWLLCQSDVVVLPRSMLFSEKNCLLCSCSFVVHLMQVFFPVSARTFVVEAIMLKNFFEAGHVLEDFLFVHNTTKARTANEHFFRWCGDSSSLTWAHF